MVSRWHRKDRVDKKPRYIYCQCKPVVYRPIWLSRHLSKRSHRSISLKLLSFFESARQNRISERSVLVHEKCRGLSLSLWHSCKYVFRCWQRKQLTCLKPEPQ